MPRRPRAQLDNVPLDIVQPGHNRQPCLCDEEDFQVETYLLSRQRHIELNPVRADPVDAPAHYPWTSYRHNAGGKPQGADKNRDRVLLGGSRAGRAALAAATPVCA